MARVAAHRLQSIARSLSMSAHSSPPSLSSFSACEVSDALIKLGVPSGGLIPDVHMLSPSPSNPSSSTLKLCAPAYTVQMVLASDANAPKLSQHFVDTATPGSVIVVSAPPQAKNAVWGGLMTAGAQARGALGVVISGRCRDLAEHRDAGFPVFARGHSTVGQSPFVRPAAVNVPLHIPVQGVGADGPDAFPPTTVEPGDWIIADEDGVICVPKDKVDEVVRIAHKGKEVDAKCMEDIKAGKGVQASFKLHRGK